MLQCSFRSEFSLLTLSITQLHGRGDETLSDSRTALHPRRAEIWGWVCRRLRRKGGGGTQRGRIRTHSMQPGSPAFSGSWEMDPQIKMDTDDFPSPAASQDVRTGCDVNRHWMESRWPACQAKWAEIAPVVDKYHFLHTFDLRYSYPELFYLRENEWFPPSLCITENSSIWETLKQVVNDSSIAQFRCQRRIFTVMHDNCDVAFRYLRVSVQLL